MVRTAGVLAIALGISACSAAPPAGPQHSASASTGTSGNAVYPIIVESAAAHTVAIHGRRQSDFADEVCRTLEIAPELVEHPSQGCPRPKDRPVEKWGAE